MGYDLLLTVNDMDSRAETCEDTKLYLLLSSANAIKNNTKEYKPREVLWKTCTTY
jgi:hypothetical protein